MMSHHNKLFETAEIVFRELYIIYNIQYTYHVSSQIIFSSTKGAKRRKKFMFIVAIVIYCPPNFKTVRVSHASDRRVTDVITVMSRQARVMSAVCLSYAVYRSVTSKHSWEFCLDYNRD